MDCSMPGFPFLHYLPESAQIHVHWVKDAIQPSHPLSSPFPPAPIPPGIRVFSNESILRMRWPKYWSFSFSIIPSKKSQGWSPGLVGSPCSPRDSQESSPTPQFKSLNSLALSFLHGLLLGRKVMTNLDSILKSRDITLSTKVRLVKAMVFPVVMCGCESWTVKKAERWRIDAFEMWFWCAAVHGVTKSWIWLSNWIELTYHLDTIKTKCEIP